MNVSDNYHGNSSKTGVYYVRCIATNQYYVGATTRRFSQRKGGHYYQLKNGLHQALLLQEAWDAYGEDHFEFGILEFVEDVDKLHDFEQYWTDQLESNTTGFNRRTNVTSNVGLRPTEASKAKQSEALKGITPKNISLMREKQKRKVDEYFNGVYVQTHESGKAAGDFHGIEYKLINNMCRGIVKRMRCLPGYSFSYSDGKGVREVITNPNSAHNKVSLITIK